MKKVLRFKSLKKTFLFLNSLHCGVSEISFKVKEDVKLRNYVELPVVKMGPEN